ncbi:MAG: DsrE family protein [Gammaproteobacteria bacterium]|nr:DsrE family protein [Gammaproteobacteria bacterium]
MSKRLTLILQEDPSANPRRVNDALRYVGAALTQEMPVRLHLLGPAVRLARRDPDADPSGLLAELIEVGLSVSACGKSLDDHALADEHLRPEVERASMKALAQWSAESDLVLSF